MAIMVLRRSGRIDRDQAAHLLTWTRVCPKRSAAMQWLLSEDLLRTDVVSADGYRAHKKSPGQSRGFRVTLPRDEPSA